MAKPRLDISTGKRYGHVTVIGEALRDDFGHICFRAKCDCGNEITEPAHFFTQNPMCPACRKMQNQQKRRDDYSGRVINSWKIIRWAGYNNQGSELYSCRCLLCGCVSEKTLGAIKFSHGQGCQYCPPNYNFVVHGNAAEGTLSDGTKFLIDADMIEAVSEHYWKFKEKKKYIISSGRNDGLIRLHRFVLGLTDENVIVDHINRNTLDCRRENLRIVTDQQNSMNKSLQKNSTTGYTGVVYLKDKNRYRSVIGLNKRRIYLLTSASPEECAQAYNIAADLIFGEFRGHVNDVPDPPLSLTKLITQRCKPYINEALEATQPCGFFDARKEAVS